MRVFVTGGTGAIGNHALPALTASGHEVTAMVRTPSKAEAVRNAGATHIDVSIFDRAGLTRAFRGHDAVVNLATALPSTQRFIMQSAWADCTRIRTERVGDPRGRGAGSRCGTGRAGIGGNDLPRRRRSVA